MDHPENSEEYKGLVVNSGVAQPAIVNPYLNRNRFARRRLTAIKRPSQALGRFMSKFLGLAEEVAPDAQGRVRLSQPLMRAAGLHKDVVLVGMGWKFEVWDQARFEQLETEDVSAELDALGVDISL